MSRKFVLILLGGALSSFFVVPFLFASLSSNYKNEHPVNLLLANFLGTKTALAYDQHHTHPALTSEAVNFFNLNFPKNIISEKEKQLLIKGVVEEDILPRPMNHFYDPVFKRGWAGFRSSKLWARSSAEQQETRGLLALNPLISEKYQDDWPADFSYERALLDYAKGNKERAFEAFGHVLHLLEDANVPEHTRNDTHMDIGHNTGSPYEKVMAKWNLNNFQVAKKLRQSGQKPILLNNLDSYFDSIAGYSNGYFFSEDTIGSKKYIKPELKEILEDKDGTTYAIGIDKNSEKFLLAKLKVRIARNFVEIKEASLIDEKHNSKILDGYWERLSKDFVLHGAGALKMFLEQAEEVKKEYEKRVTEKKEKKGWLANIFGGKTSGVVLVKDILATVENQTETGFLSQTEETPFLSTLIPHLETPFPSGESQETEAQPFLRSNVEPLATPKEENVGGGALAVLPVIYQSGCCGNQTAQPTPTLTPEVSATPSPTSSPVPEDSALRKIVINEIAWMGTNASANDEWIELYNTTSKSVDLTGWTLKAQDGTPDISISPISIGPFGFYLLERTDNTTVSDILADQTYVGALENEGEILELRDGSNDLQDSISQPTSGDWYAGSNTTKSSMERINPKTRGDEQSNWGTNNGTTKNGLDSSSGLINGTPKSKNSLYVTQKPTKVTNLNLTSQTSLNSIYLTWTTPNDSDTAFGSLAYDLRYATKSFDMTDDWDSAKMVASLSAVDNYGVTASLSFTIQDFNKTYYFVLKTKDNDNNYSDISNQISHTIGQAVSASGWPMSGLNQKHTLKTGFLGPASSATKIKGSVQHWSSPPTNFGQAVIAPNGNIYFGISNGTMSQLWVIMPTNAEVWQYSGTGGAAVGTPAVMADNSVIFGYSSNGTNVTRLDVNKAIKYENNIGQVGAVTVGTDGTAYFTSSADKILAIKPDGTEKWRTYKDGITSLTPAILDDGKVYVTARVSGVPTFYSFDSESGSLLWTKTMSTNSSTCCGVSDLSYDADNDFLYAGASQYILKIDRNGTNLEQFEADRLVGWGHATTMISQDTNNLIFGLDFSINNPASKSAVYAVNKSSKEVAWKYAVDAKINKQITIDSGGNSYFSTQNGWVYSLNQNGVLNWKFDINGTTSAYPVIGQGVLYIVMDGARIVKIGE